MKKTVLLASAAAAVLCMIGTPQTAEAAVTCKYIPNLCPKDSDTRGPSGPGGSSNTGGGGNSGTVGVPEPATLALLGTGVAALGVAVIRRRKK